MKKIFLLVQLMCTSALFASESSSWLRLGSPSNPRSEVNDEVSDRRSVADLSEPAQLGEVTSEYGVEESSLDALTFKRWYENCFKTKVNKVDGAIYFLKMSGEQAKLCFRLSEMSPDTQVSGLSVSISGVMEDTFKTYDNHPTSFNYTVNRNMRLGEVKGTFGNMLSEVMKIRQNVLEELSEACASGYTSHLPLDTVEVRNEAGVFYLVYGMAQQSLTRKRFFTKEPESIRIQLKLPGNYPECYVDSQHLSIYHSVYSSVNEWLIQSLTGISEFDRIEGYSLVQDIAQNQSWWARVEKEFAYLTKDGLEPTIYIPTYQREALSYKGYESLSFKRTDNNSFTTERVNGLQYSLDTTGPNSDFMISDLGEAEVDHLRVSYKDASDTEFVYETKTKVQGTMATNVFADMLPKVKEMTYQFAKIESTEHPISMVRIRQEGDKRYLDLIAGRDGPRLQIELGKDGTGKYLTKEILAEYQKLQTIVTDEIQKIAKPHFKSSHTYVQVPEILKRQEGWSDVEIILHTIGNASILIQDYQRDAVIDKGYELLTFTSYAGYNPDYFYYKTETIDGFQYEILNGLQYSLDATGPNSDFMISDLGEAEVNHLRVSYKDASGTEFVYETKTKVQGTMAPNVFADMLPKVKEMTYQFAKIDPIEHPVSMVRIRQEGDKRYLDLIADTGAPRLQIELGKDGTGKYLTKDTLDEYQKLQTLVTDEIEKIAKPRKSSDVYVQVPETFKRHAGWPDVENMLYKIGNASILIQDYQRDAVIDKGYELLTFTSYYEAGNHPNYFHYKTETIDGFWYRISSQPAIPNRFSFRLSDIVEKGLTYLGANVHYAASGNISAGAQGKDMGLLPAFQKAMSEVKSKIK